MLDRPPAAVRHHYPFTAVVGLDTLKLALVLNAISPRTGGVLIRGEKGTAKSTIVRALAALLPPVAVVAGCRFSCDPAAPDPACPDGPHGDGPPAAVRPARLAELPVGASEDRLVGSLDLERALTEGVKAFEPGLLAAAHRGVLYVDEVNLLHDHLVDLLLDAAALGTCYVERDAVSVRHAARFMLVGTMNPEEGELRPQLLDRFGLTVEVTASRDPEERAQVVRRRLAFEDDAEAFAARWADAEDDLAARIAAARDRLCEVTLSDAALTRISTICAAFDVDGMRADLITAHAAVAHAAWRGGTRVTAEDIRQAARLALPHRRRRDPFDAPGLDESELDALLDDAELDDPVAGEAGPEEPGRPDEPRADEPGLDGPFSEGGSGTDPGPASGQDPVPGPDDDPDPGPPPGPGGSGGAPEPPSANGHGAQAHDAPAGESAGTRTRPVAQPGGTYRVRALTVPGLGTGAPGRRSRARTSYGRVSGSRVPGGRLLSPHLTATLRAAAPYQRERGRTGPGLVVRRGDLREAVREGREGNLVLFVVDASGSMAARRRMGAVKGAVLSLLLDAYQRRDKVGLVTFRGSGAELVLPPTSSVEAGAARLRELPTGGRTPLAAGLRRAAEVVRVERLRDPARRPLLVVVTDGRATSGTAADVRRAASLLRGVAAVVVDCESGPVRLGLATGLAVLLGGEAVRLERLAAGGLRDLVREHRKAA
ncbi:VWA domain-containing protein [Sphaerisporangium album]|uniref:Mg-protoporphyrin IX chelatase n=1 Tax=Sphaerisporangium album TaxID=509200 RepID=A0A367EXA2_9ACTN|nr:magnesium chelatase subunit D family protein [Sphaerisporangium album]RCG22776.1 VWA domain-containing protein [Sphaerisporangium album]